MATTPEQCLVNGGSLYFGVEKAMFQMGNMYLLRSPVQQTGRPTRIGEEGACNMRTLKRRAAAGGGAHLQSAAVQNLPVLRSTRQDFKNPRLQSRKNPKTCPAQQMRQGPSSFAMVLVKSFLGWRSVDHPCHGT